MYVLVSFSFNQIQKLCWNSSPGGWLAALCSAACCRGVGYSPIGLSCGFGSKPCETLECFDFGFFVYISVWALLDETYLAQIIGLLACLSRKSSPSRSIPKPLETTPTKHAMEYDRIELTDYRAKWLHSTYCTHRHSIVGICNGNVVYSLKFHPFFFSFICSFHASSITKFCMILMYLALVYAIRKTTINVN